MTRKLSAPGRRIRGCGRVGRGRRRRCRSPTSRRTERPRPGRRGGRAAAVTASDESRVGAGHEPNRLQVVERALRRALACHRRSVDFGAPPRPRQRLRSGGSNVIELTMAVSGALLTPTALRHSLEGSQQLAVDSGLADEPGGNDGEQHTDDHERDDDGVHPLSRGCGGGEQHVPIMPRPRPTPSPSRQETARAVPRSGRR